MPPIEKQQESEVIDDFEWNVYNEIHLFHALINSKPAGINKYFHMTSIADKFSTYTRRDVPTQVIWKHLETMWNQKLLDEIEGIPFPNDESDFSLPEDYAPLLKQKTKDVNSIVEDASDGSASPKVQNVPRSISRSTVVKDSTPKVSKKDQQAEKCSKKETPAASASQASPAEATPSKGPEKETAKPDPRRDSKDSNSSSKEGGSVKGTSRTPASKDTKAKASRASVSGSERNPSEDSPRQDDTPNKRAVKRPTRGSLKEEQPPPPSRRRRT